MKDKFKKYRSLEVTDETKRIRMLRLMVQFTISLIYQGDLSRDEALERVSGVRKFALKLFPGKETAFELIYSPKFKRAIEEIYGTH